LINQRRSSRGAENIKSSLEILDDSDLERLALMCAKKVLPLEIRTATARRRSEVIHRWVLRRAKGVCEGCGTMAPFRREDGSPYLEPHHTRRVADDGPDDPRTVIALCPTCHKKVHHAHDRDTYNQRLIAKLKRIQS
jgi:predicted HNH restriction endonuclease